MARRNRRNEQARRGYQSTRQTVAALREMGEYVVSAAKRALANAVPVIVTDAKTRCPVRTGALKASIHLSPSRDGSFYRVVADAKDENGVPYGKFVEYDPRINKPFMTPALEAHRNEVYRAVQNAIRQAIDAGV